MKVTYSNHEEALANLPFNEDVI